MSKYGFDRREIRKIRTVMIDKDGFHKETITDVMIDTPIQFTLLRRIETLGESKYLYEVGMSRKLNADEELLIFNYDDFMNAYEGKKLASFPSIAPVILEDPVVFVDKPTSTDLPPCPVYVHICGSYPTGFYNYLFVRKKSTNDIIGTNYDPNVPSGKILQTQSIDLTEDGSISLGLTTPLLYNERIVLVPTSDKYIDPYLAPGYKLPERHFDVDSIDVERSSIGEREIKYSYFPIANHGLPRLQRCYIAIVDEEDYIVDCRKAVISRV